MRKKPTEIAHTGKDSTLRRARTSLWWPKMNKQLKQFIDICEVCNAFHTKNQQTLVKIWVWYFFSGPLSGFSWLLWTCHRLAPGVGPLANQLQENMSGNPSQPLWNLVISRDKSQRRRQLGRVVRRWTFNSEARSSSPVLTSSWISSQ